MAATFEKLREALGSEKYRWIALEDYPAGATDRLHEFLANALGAPPEWFFSGDANLPDVRQGFTDSSCPWVVIDGYEESERSRLCQSLKRYLKNYPNRKMIFVSACSFVESDIPSYLGLGTIVSCGVAENVRDDRGLLLHSRRIHPKYQLNDLVLGTRNKIKFTEAIEYIRTSPFVLDEWGFRKRHNRGHGITMVFNGASGTGKTMAAEVVANEVGLPLYQIDLSSVVSKWVGETEKNLKSIFRSARGVNGILLFDEGDAIFGTRTSVEGAQDRYANLEVNYLLQELELFDGVALLSTNHEKNMDPAFLRRFTFSISFARPSETQRLQIWKASSPPELPLGSTVDFTRLSAFALTGGNIRNCLRIAAARAAMRKGPKLEQVDLLWAIKRELQKHQLPFSRETVGEEFWRQVGPEWEDAPGLR